MNSNSTYLDRTIKSALAIFNHDNLDPVTFFPSTWTNVEINLFLDMLLEYCIHPDQELWEQAAIIRDVKKEINTTW